jgi:hypothetical protein
VESHAGGRRDRKGLVHFERLGSKESFETLLPKRFGRKKGLIMIMLRFHLWNFAGRCAFNLGSALSGAGGWLCGLAGTLDAIADSVDNGNRPKKLSDRKL